MHHQGYVGSKSSRIKPVSDAQQSWATLSHNFVAQQSCPTLVKCHCK